MTSRMGMGKSLTFLQCNGHFLIFFAGLVSPVKNQGRCSSCVAFASIAVVETCFKKITGSFGNYSEQQLLDCSYDFENAQGCRGAALHSYLVWLAEKHSSVTTEEAYPYMGDKDPNQLPCRDDDTQDEYSEMPKVKKSIYKYNGSEDELKKLVYTNGAVVAGIQFTNATGQKLYYFPGSSIFTDCSDDDFVKTNTLSLFLVMGLKEE